jgi:hypothetical protein
MTAPYSGHRVSRRWSWEYMCNIYRRDTRRLLEGALAQRRARALPLETAPSQQTGGLIGSGYHQ